MSDFLRFEVIHRENAETSAVKPNWKPQTWTKSADQFLQAIYEVYELDCSVPKKIEYFETVQGTVSFPVPSFR